MFKDERYRAKTGGRVVVSDTITILETADAGAILVSASHGGISSGEFALAVPLPAVFFNDAGIGKDRAGVAGIDFLETRGIAAGAVAHTSAMIGEGMDAWENGVISVLNAPAEAMGFHVGEPLQAAACRVADAGLPDVVFTEAPRHADLRKVPVDGYGERIILMDSISMIREPDAGAAVVSSSHGGAVSGEFALMHRPRVVFFNDGGIGRNEAGVASLALLDAEGIACGAVGHESARIGDCIDHFENGVLTRVNTAAKAMGFREGDRLKRALARVFPL